MLTVMSISDSTILNGSGGSGATLTRNAVDHLVDVQKSVRSPLEIQSELRPHSGFNGETGRASSFAIEHVKRLVV